MISYDKSNRSVIFISKFLHDIVECRRNFRIKMEIILRVGIIVRDQGLVQTPSPRNATPPAATQLLTTPGGGAGDT